MSLPLRKCGLKLANLIILNNLLCHFPCGSVDWNCSVCLFVVLPTRHFPCGSVDWNKKGGLQAEWLVRHFPCGSVDWNARNNRISCQLSLSLPLRKCGLKHPKSNLMFPSFSVTSLAEVWIETVLSRWGTPRWYMSLPLRKCGLKRLAFATQQMLESHFPCGSVDWNLTCRKQDLILYCHFPCGSVDWNYVKNLTTRVMPGHFPCGSVDWNKCLDLTLPWFHCHFPCGSVDWNIYLFCIYLIVCSHFPCGSVDWNTICGWVWMEMPVTSLAEVWIETAFLSAWRGTTDVTSLAEVWIETSALF